MHSFPMATAKAVATADQSKRGKSTPLLTLTLGWWAFVCVVGRAFRYGEMMAEAHLLDGREPPACNQMLYSFK